MTQSAAVNILVSLGAGTMNFVTWVGGLAVMTARTMARGVKRPWGLRDIIYQFSVVGVRSWPLTNIMSLFVGMILAWTIGQALTDFGAKSAIGNVTSLGLVRELVPSFLAVTVGCKMATGMTAELGSMKVTEQIDAISALGADPIKKLVVPRVVAATLTMPLLVAWGNLIALLGGMFISHTAFDVSAQYYYATYNINRANMNAAAERAFEFVDDRDLVAMPHRPQAVKQVRTKKGRDADQHQGSPSDRREVRVVGGGALVKNNKSE